MPNPNFPGELGSIPYSTIIGGPLNAAVEDDDSTLSLTVDLFELLEREDVEGLDYEDTVYGADGPGGGKPSHGRGQGRSRYARPNDPSIDVLDPLDDAHAARLRGAGIQRLTDVVERSPEELAVAASEDADVSPDRASDWLEEARWLTAILDSVDSDGQPEDEPDDESGDESGDDSGDDSADDESGDDEPTDESSDGTDTQ